MTTHTFEVQGSEPDPYIVTISRTGDNVTATCTCRAAENNMHCKHRIRIIHGDASDVVSDNIDEVDLYPEHIKGSDVETALNQLDDAEITLASAKKQVSALKKALARKLTD